MPAPGSTTAPKGLFGRVRALFLGGPSLKPVVPLSTRMPDLEQWAMPHRSVDIADWENAYNMARNPLAPDRSRLLDLYDSILLDSHLASVIESRVLRVVGGKFKLVDKEGKAKPELLPMFEKQWFLDFLKYTAESIFRGHTLIELGQLREVGELRDVTRIDQRNVMPWLGVVRKNPGSTDGYKYTEPPLNSYLIEVGRKDDLGVLSQVAPIVIIKKYAVGSWSDYVERFGIPAMWVTTTTTDKKRMDQLQDMLTQIRSRLWAILGSDEKFETMPTPGVDAHKVFDELIKRMNSETSKRILGQDGTSDSKDTKGTYGSLQILAGVAEDRHKADKQLVSHVVNTELLPRLVNLGYKLGDVRFAWDELADLAPMQLVEAVSALAPHYDIDPKYIEERTGIRIDGVRRMPGEAAGGNTDNPLRAGRQSGAKKGEGQEPKGDDDDEEDGVTARWPSDKPHTCPRCKGRRRIVAIAPPVAQAVVDQLLRDAHASGSWSQPYFEEVSRGFQDALLSNFNLDGIDYDAPDHVARVAMESNLFRFGATKTLAAVTQLNAIARDSRGFADFKRKAEESGLLDNYNRRWLEVEHTNVVNTGMQASRWYQMQRSADALPYGEYYTQGDDQVRPAHAELDGKRWPLSHPIWSTIWPPNGWACRCTVLPTDSGPDAEELKTQTGSAMATLENAGELKRMRAGGFDKNRAVTGEVFALNKSYRDQLDGVPGTKHAYNVEQSYGGKGYSMADIYNRDLPKPPVGPATKEAAQRWFEGVSKDGVLVVKDATGKPWTFERSSVEEHLNGAKYADKNRHETLHLVPDVVASPDEVWLTTKGGTNARYTYIKYYEGKPVVVRADVEADRLRISTWYEMEPSKEGTIRNGLLVKRMPAGARA